jgi:hypothetical protein
MHRKDAEGFFMNKASRILAPLAAAAFALFSIGCGGSDIQPKLLDPAYKAKLVFTDGFDLGLQNWLVQGQGSVRVVSDTSLEMIPASDTSGVVVWSKPSFSENFQLEYEIFIADTPGTHLVYLCATGLDGEEFFENTMPPPEQFNDFMKNRLNSYQIYVHCYDRMGSAVSGSRLRKNPSNLLLSGNPSDPCKDNRRYLIDAMKVGSRIQFYVDGASVHDVRDRGGFGPVYMKGRIGLMVQGKAGAFRAFIKNVRVFKLIPR